MLLAAPNYMNDLLGNVKNNGISECYNGVEFIAKQINNYYKQKYKNQHLIAISPSGYANFQKHLGDIPKILKQNGFKIIYIITFSDFWSDLETKLKEEGEDYIFAEFEFAECLDFFPFMLSQKDNTYVSLNKKVTSLRMLPSMEMCPSPIVYPEKQSAYDLLNYKSTYINIHSQKFLKIINDRQKLFSGIGVDVFYKLLKGGYPSIDNHPHLQCENYKDLDSVIIVGGVIENYFFDELCRVMDNLLKLGYRVVFKDIQKAVGGHIASADKIERIKEGFCGYKNFVWYVEPNLSDEELKRSITLIGAGTSSMEYSYPTIAKKPAILLYFGVSSSDKVLESDSFYHPSLHIRICKDELDTLPQVLETLKSDEDYQAQRKALILDYCQNDLYNYGYAGEFIAQWIMNWYENREILKES